MMTQRIRGTFLAALAAAFSVLSGTSAIEAGFLDQLESLQNVHGVSRQFKFEGATAADRQNDSGGHHIDLLSAAGEGGSGTNDPDTIPMSGDEVPWSYPAGDVNLIGYEGGFDGPGTSQAYRPQGMAVTSTFAAEVLSQRRSGAGLYTDNFTSTSLMTFEAVIKPDVYREISGGPHYIFQTRPGTGRGYYLSQVGPTGTRNVGGTITPIIGSNIAERPSLLLDYSDPAQWYYIAATIDLSGGAAGFAVVDSYYANLTTGGPLVHSLNDYTFAATIGATLLNTNGFAGVGMFVRPGATVLGQEFFFGSIDNLAIYHHTLTDAQIEHHHRALTVVGVPEPASIALLGLGAVLACGLRRRSS